MKLVKNTTSTQILPFIFVPLYASLLFLQLFVPEPSLFVTPDFGLSDLLDGYYPLKFLLDKSLEEGTIPLWTQLIATGYPILADGQIGYFNLGNQLIYRVFPFVAAINMSFISIYALTGWGTYLYAREIKQSVAGSLFASCVAMLSGFNIAQISHMSIIQSAAYFPILLFIVEKILSGTQKSLYLSLFSIVFSQQIFAGHLETTAYSTLFISIYILMRVISQKQTREHILKLFSLFVLSGLVSLLLAAVFLIPAIELFNSSVRSTGQGTTYNYPLSYMRSFIHPFIDGSPANGTFYKNPLEFDAIFWENTGYVGIIPLIALMYALIQLRKSARIQQIICIIVISLVFVWGRQSPFYFMFDIPPLSSFRVPSRALFVTNFFLAVIAGFVVSHMLTRIKNVHIASYIFAGLVLAHTANILYFFYDYHPVLPAKTILGQAKIVTSIDTGDTSRVWSTENSQAWNAIFFSEGWKHPEKYTPFANNLTAQSNFYHDIPKSDFFVIFKTNRMNVMESLFRENMSMSEKNELTIAPPAKHILSLLSNRYLLVPSSYTLADYKKVADTQTASLYENNTYVNRAYFVYNYEVTPNVEDVVRTLNSPGFVPGKTVLLERSLDQQFLPDDNFTVNWIANTDQYVELSVNTQTAGLLILADTYYPGWKAYVDNIETDIYPANINQRAIIVPQGEHEITFEYKPQSFLYGALISVVSHVLLAIVLTRGFLARALASRVSLLPFLPSRRP